MSAEGKARFEASVPQGDGKPIQEVAPSGRFEKIASPQTVDYALRTVQQGLVHFSSMADTKANILITVCALLFSIGRSEPDPRHPRGAADGLAPDAARPARAGSGPLQSALLHAHRDARSRTLPRRDGRVDGNRPGFYEAILRDIYGQSVALTRKKYRLLRWSYAALLPGVISALLLLLGRQLTR